MLKKLQSENKVVNLIVKMDQTCLCVCLDGVREVREVEGVEEVDLESVLGGEVGHVVVRAAVHVTGAQHVVTGTEQLHHAGQGPHPGRVTQAW